MMTFPEALKQKSRKQRKSSKIKNWNYLYSRHKPSSNWNHDEGLPDFTKIKVDQSFNWCNFSTPAWCRFNDQGEYMQDYAVAGFHVKSIRNKYREETDINASVDLDHKPLELNYSHCELVIDKSLTRKERRDLRMTFRHNCRVPIKPDEKVGKIRNFLSLINMYFRRLLSGNYTN